MDVPKVKCSRNYKRKLRFSTLYFRFTVVMEYEQKPILPPPFIVFSHIYLLFKFIRRKMDGKEEMFDNGLKLFLDRDEMERLYDFEEDCVEGYFAEQESKLQQSTEERIKVTTERIEHLTQVRTPDHFIDPMDIRLIFFRKLKIYTARKTCRRHYFKIWKFVVVNSLTKCKISLRNWNVSGLLFPTTICRPPKNLWDLR